MHIRWLLTLVLSFLTLGCRQDEPRPREPMVREPESIQTAYLEDVVPLIDGGAYAVGLDGLWYLSGTSAIRVRPLGDSVARAGFASAGFRVQPTVDGGAYAFELGGGIWRLVADSAMLVTEAGIISPDTTIAISGADSAGWMLYTIERRRREGTADDDGAGLDERDPAEQGP